MGHSRLGTLPDTRPWRKVVGTIADGAAAAAVAQATSQAAENGLLAAQKDPGFAQVVFLLARVVLAARDEEFSESLSRLGVEVPTEPTVYDLSAGFSAALRAWHHDTQTHRSDFAAMAGLAATESLTSCARNRAGSLFPTESDDRCAVRTLSTPGGFSILAHEFFSRFTRRYLTYHLDRELPLHTGGCGRFSDHAARREFDADLEVHCREAALITKTYAGEWYSKAKFESGVSLSDAKRFSTKCLKKIGAELAVRGGLGG